eukprot:CAMPEP_0114588634 /NCGR_PEP_ID=MMETSP0125-20121206/11283_1 /TAXON_ID=485358 ORGANISM="Aristerostoma sp., Strain ATCC 50986" /NCGR_SAMPLE_ID=MMETSP0125 /ASSEMBLY_ACC=CAM_ASM_000245 /LENGTH=121 /DNA_ID=CAMNT_0001785119 /DNA_START=629 /DNA_END=994 /DNA_ORIENTATION=-
MKSDLERHYDTKTLKDYFDKVFIGFYDEKIFNKYLNVNQALTCIKQQKASLSEGLTRFDAEIFTTKWKEELERMNARMKELCESEIFTMSELSFHNPKSPTKHPIEQAAKKPGSVTCLVNL